MSESGALLPGWKLVGVGVGILEVRDRDSNRLFGWVQREDDEHWLGMRVGGGNFLTTHRGSAAKWVAGA